MYGIDINDVFPIPKFKQLLLDIPRIKKGKLILSVLRSVKDNGCLQVLKGSHRLGRISHVLSGEQAGADADFLEAALSRFSLEYVEMEPGDVLFFHCNLLHSRYEFRQFSLIFYLIFCAA